MKRYFAALLIALLMTLAVPALAAEEAPPGAAPPTPPPAEEKPTLDFTTYFLSKYVWRGYENTKDSLVIQPSLTAGYKGFSVNLWGNLDTNPYSAGPQSYSSTWTETDLTLAYNKTFGILNAGVGYIYYGLDAPNAGAPDPPDSQEVFATLGLNTLLTPTLTVYKEVDHYHQWYFLLGVSHVFEFSKTVSLKLAASGSYLKSESATPTDPLNIGYPKFNDSHLPTNDKFNNFHDGLVSASLPIALVKYVTLTPIISYSFPLSSDAKNEIKGRSKNGNDDNFLFGGVGLTFAF
jgi:hypothetical protein